MSLGILLTLAKYLAFKTISKKYLYLLAFEVMRARTIIYCTILSIFSLLLAVLKLLTQNDKNFLDGYIF